MKNQIVTTASAALLALTFAAPAAQAMDAELNSLTGSIYRTLSSMEMDVASINQLTLGDLQLIRNIMSSSDSEGEKKGKIDAILRRAAK